LYDLKVKENQELLLNLKSVENDLNKNKTILIEID